MGTLPSASTPLEVLVVTHDLPWHWVTEHKIPTNIKDAHEAPLGAEIGQ